MKIKRLLPMLLALVMSLTLAVPAFAVIWTTETDRVPISAGGINYETWACLYQDDARTFRGSTWVQNTSYANLPDAFMGISSRLYKPNGDIYAEAEMQFNVGGIYFQFSLTPSAVVDDVGVFTGGEVALYTGTGYQYQPTPTTVLRYPTAAAVSESDVLADALDELALTLTANDGYPVTASGKTYGSGLLSDLTGETPELVAAEGVGGKRGYVLADDLRFNITDLGDALEYMEYLENTEDTYRAIPLYDLNENVIGSFQIQLPRKDREIPPEVQKTIDQLNAERGPSGRNAGLPEFPLKPLIGAVGTQGESGYIRESDTAFGQWTIQTPADAVRYMEFLSTQPKVSLIPLYNADGKVIGRFRVGNSH